jgi:hypothetical protein
VVQVMDFEGKHQLNGRYLVSLYQPLAKLSITESATHIKSILLHSIRSHPTLAPMTQLHEKLVDQIIKEVKPLAQTTPGIACFFVFDAEAIERTRSRERDLSKHFELLLITLQVEPMQRVYLGRTFDLIPLLSALQQQQAALAIQLENKSAKIYSLIGSEWQQLVEKENIYNEPTDKEYLQAYNANRPGTIFHSTGSENIARRQISANKALLSDVEKELKRIINKQAPSWKDVVIYMAPDFLPFAPDWATSLLTSLMDRSPILVDNTMPPPDEISQHALQTLKQHHLTELKQRLKAYDRDKNLVLGWQEVTSAVRERRVETLYINPDAKKAGFLIANSLPYTYPVGESRRIHNLAPWLTKIVLESSGEVIPTTLDPISEKEVGAEIRWESQ